MRSWAHCSDYTGYYSGGAAKKQEAAGNSTLFSGSVRVKFLRRGSTVLSDCHDGDGPPSAGRPAESKPPEARRKARSQSGFFGGLICCRFVFLQQK